MVNKIKKGYVHAIAKNGIIGNEIKFSKISVGATENIIIAACLLVLILEINISYLA